MIQYKIELNSSYCLIVKEWNTPNLSIKDNNIQNHYYVKGMFAFQLWMWVGFHRS